MAFTLFIVPVNRQTRSWRSPLKGLSQASCSNEIMFLTSVSSCVLLERSNSLCFEEELLICSVSLSCLKNVLRYSATKLPLRFRLNPFVPPEVWVSLFTVSSHVWSKGTLPKGLLLLSWTESPPELRYSNASGCYLGSWKEPGVIDKLWKIFLLLSKRGNIMQRLKMCAKGSRL